MALFFTSDHHFGHGAARGLFQRPFATTAAMDAAMVARWNQVVGPDDEVWHLGDFAVRQSAARMGELLDALPGTKHLIVGNNDGPATTGLTQWASVQHYAELEVDGTWLIMCHYPLRTWNRTRPRRLQPARPQPRPPRATISSGRRRRGLLGFPPDHARRHPSPSAQPQSRCRAHEGVGALPPLANARDTVPFGRR